MERDPTTKTSSCVKDNRSFYYLKNKVGFYLKHFFEIMSYTVLSMFT